MNINRILENRFFSGKGNPYEIFEKKVIEALYLERKIMMLKLGKREQYQERIQYITFLVSCMEYYLGEVFKNLIESEIINIEKLKKYKKLRNIKVDLKELEVINKNKIRFSEILVEEMNFQNINDIANLCDLLKMEENFKIISLSKKDYGLKYTKEIMPKLSKNFSSRDEKKMTKFILKSFFQSNFNLLPKDLAGLMKIFNTIKKMIAVRHKIVHKAHLIKIDNWESLAYTMATVQLAFLVNECYKISNEKVNKQ